jgi:hypothetical protein
MPRSKFAIREAYRLYDARRRFRLRHYFPRSVTERGNEDQRSERCGCEELAHDLYHPVEPLTDWVWSHLISFSENPLRFPEAPLESRDSLCATALPNERDLAAKR